jgi:hypothetical protein
MPESKKKSKTRTSEVKIILTKKVLLKRYLNKMTFIPFYYYYYFLKFIIIYLNLFTINQCY